ncbi:multiheme c-type cytochrome [Neobacillus massiliamazoniensis]|uniref:Doubled CXXCH motif (Paired_CXXCH_1) n=1 Tax=Neobacillus massiliamazoniensis TaxID=1499688 RepID=A0A0U1NTM8_9BACI|nr:cytochrome c3 family protein [Neobacillus massiliamazoniensis]CRK81397.1 Doubled CXXCH motif (Paired_CXXCH_1) [Neobacillus massiliamazoniensis]
MRKLILHYKTYFYSFLLLVLLGATCLSFPSVDAYSSGSVTPNLSLDSPKADAVLNSKNVVISGTYSDNVDKANLHFTATENGNVISDSTLNQSDWVIDDTKTPITWTLSTSKLAEGNHAIIVTVEELPTSDTSLKASANISFTIVLSRPYVTATGIILPDGKVDNGEDLTSVPLDAKIKFTVVDDQPMNNLKNKLKPTPFQPIKILQGTNTVPGTTVVNELGVQNGKYSYDIIFTPDNSLLQLNKSYLVFLDPGVVDDLDNPVFTRFFKFTTKSVSSGDDPANPHGHFSLNTNMCATCHTTHNSKSSSLIGGSNQITFNEQLTKNQPDGDPSQNYCMACHDGTTNAPFDKNSGGFHHANPVDTASEAQALKQPNSCTSCHNPHLERSDSNPNLLKDHYVYKHSAVNPDKGLVNATVDSLDTSCDTCHNNIDFSTISADKGMYELFAYKKSSTAVGSTTAKFNVPTDPEIPTSTISDYSLCLRCHNLEKKKQKTVKADIESYYLNTNSGHNFTFPTNATTQKDGSILNGPIACADCHETHGSNNLFNLREVLGPNPALSDSDKYITSGTDWNADNERRFCLACHNKGTEIFGKKAVIDKTISGHQDTDTQACSNCHSDKTKTYASFRDQSMSAAHAPLNFKP